MKNRLKQFGTNELLVELAKRLGEEKKYKDIVEEYIYEATWNDGFYSKDEMTERIMKLVGEEFSPDCIKQAIDEVDNAIKQQEKEFNF